MTVLDFVKLLRANLLLMVITTLLGAAAGWGFSLVQTPLYTSSSTGFVVVEAQGEGQSTVLSGSDLAQERAQSYLPLIHSRAVQDEIQRSTGSTVAHGTLSADVAPNSNLITVSATASDAAAAADLANAALQATADVANRLEGGSVVRVEALEDAQVPASPSSPDTIRNVLYGAGFGLLAGLTIAFLRRLLDVNVRTTTDVQQAARAGLLGTLPRDDAFQESGAGASTGSPRAMEAVRQLRTNLKFVSIDNPPRTISFTSANPGEGKSTVVASLGLALAAAGDRVIVIDADLRRPRQATLFGVEGRVGLSEVLAGQVPLEDALQVVGDDGMVLLPAGRTPPNPSELLGSERMKSLLEQLSQDSLVLVDAPPVLPVTDSTLLATSVDGTVLVVKHAKTRREHVEVARDMLGKVQANVIGVVLNETPAKGVGSDYYGGGYGATHQAYDAYLHAPNRARSTSAHARSKDLRPLRRSRS
ncbi:polysaccharide biosynthesis tyrosine autokinase [Micrococcus terreus]|uniref:polysaccharide biosynthesis tyrosine autokinase n=1 Tax=Micrococcus terreus TaxID=574650 RepID=UPI0021A87A41|nr:polysaccharide biosynthesis tyrosine autokinase [Micrococcus terreus]MCT2089514.1 polysaccharide biosynthesis tyrosine autokinase [Micrococcus terreus]